MNQTAPHPNPLPPSSPVAADGDGHRPRNAAANPPPPRGPAPAAPKRSGGSGAKPVWQTLAIVLILLAGLAGGTAILRMKPPAPAADEHGHGGGEAGEKKDDGHGHGAGEHEGHGHGGHDEHGAAGRVEMNAAKLKNANLQIEEAASAPVKTTLRLYGKVAANEENMAHVAPRFAGIVKGVRKRLGDPVARGEVLATVESNDSLRTYDVKSEIAGTVTAKNVTLGELVGNDKSMFTVTDLSSVYVDLNVHREDFGQLRVGQKVFLVASRRGGDPGADEPLPIESTVSYLSPFGAENTQSMLARAVVPNPDGVLRPGLFINARVVTGEFEAPVAVKAAALQVMDEKTVVFVQEGDSFEARTVELGHRDPEWVEIVSGVLPGDQYVAGNSFILKAEIGKEGAAHEH